MHYEYETGNCDHVSYEYHCEVVGKRDERIRQLEHENEDLKQQHLETIEEAQQTLKKTKTEYQAVIDELKRITEGILVNEK